MLERLTALLLRKRLVSALALLALILAATAGVARLQVDFSSAAFYGGDREAAERLRAFVEAWGPDDDELVILLRTGEDDRTGVLARERLDAIDRLARDVAEVEGVREAFSISSLPVPERFADRGANLAELIDESGIAAMPPTIRREALTQMPFVPALLAANGRSTLIVIELEFSSDDVLAVHPVVADIRAAMDGRASELSALAIESELAGVPAIRASFLELVVRDQSIFVPATLLLIGVCLYFSFRRWHAVWIPAAAAGVPMLMLVGIMGWAGEPVGLLNQSYFSLLPVIAVADAIHLVARVHGELEADPSASREAAIARAGSRVGLACLLTSLTTAAGFASLAVADMPILRNFGLYAAAGVCLAFLVVVVLVPLLLTLVPIERLRISHQRSASDLIVERCVRVAATRPSRVVVGCAILLALCVPLALRVELDNRLVELLDDGHPVTRASAHIDAQMGGSLGLEFDIVAEEGKSLASPELFAKLHAFERWLGDQAQVRSVEGMAGFAVGFEGELPQTHAELESTIESLERALPVERWWRPDRTHIRAGLPDSGGRAFVEFSDRAQARIDAELAGTGARAYATGTPLLAYRGVNHITSDLRASSSLVFFVIVVVIGLVFRGMGPALLAVPVNAAPLLLGYALLGATDQILDPLAAVILTLAIGIGVDNTIHVFVRFREELADSTLTGPDALVRAMATSGRAVVVTSLVVAGGLALNLFSSFPPLQMLGLLGASVLLFALAANLLLLPALLLLTSARPRV